MEKGHKSKIQNQKSKIVIVGGGVSGLAAAFRLQELKNAGEFAGEFVLLEAGDRLGGSIKTTNRDGFLLEGGADSFLSEKPEIVRLARRLGIETDLVSTNDRNRRSFLVRANRLRAVPSGFQLIAPSNLEAFFKSEILSSLGKARLANEQFLPAIFDEREDVSLAEFVRQRFGQEALERVAQPMLGGIYTADPENLSLRATQPRFLKLERESGSVIRGLQAAANQNSNSPAKNKSAHPNPKSEIGTSGARYSLFLSFRGGMQTLTDALAAKIPEKSVRLSARVAALNFERNRNRWKIKTNGETLQADAIILALPAHAIAGLLNDQFPALSSELAEIEHASTATVNLAFRRPSIAHALDGFGFVVPFVENKTLMACTFSSVKFHERALPEHVLLRAFVGGALQPEMFDLPDEAMIAAVLRDLRDLIGASGEPLFAETYRWARSMPQYRVGHLRKAERIKNLLAETASLQLATTGFDGVGVPDAVRHGEQAAENLIKLWHSN